MSQENQPSIFIASAGTGGHLFSAQKLAEKLTKDGIKITFVGKGLKNNPFFEKHTYPYYEISSSPIRKNPKMLFSIGFGFIQSIFLLLTKKVDVVVGFGSYHTFPFLLAAKLFRKKTILFEANCIVGMVNKMIASKKIPLACQFPLEKKPLGKKVIQVLPFPFSLEKDQHVKDKKEKTLLVFGGSQGAHFFNQSLPKAVSLLKEKINVIHITGSKQGMVEVENEYKNLGVKATVISFSKDMKSLYHSSDLVVSRAGALTIAELLHYKKPAILIPYPFAKDDHQKINGKFFEKIGGGKVLLQKDLSIEKLAFTIEEALSSSNHYENLCQYEKKDQVELSQLVKNLCKKNTTF